MATIALFHSVYGLRGVESQAARRLRALGHDVHVPDLYAGRTAPTIDAGFELKDHIGWATIVARANDCLRGLPDNTILIGFSMGAGVIHDLLPSRADTEAVLLFHGLADMPVKARPGLPVQLQIAESDAFASPEQVSAWRAASLKQGAAVEVHRYPGVGHFYTDDSLPDYDEQAARLTWRRAVDFLTAHITRTGTVQSPTVGARRT